MLQQELIFSRRMRRNRKSEAIRSLIQETRLHPNNFVAQFFVVEGSNQKIPIVGLPGVYRFSIDTLLKEIETHLELGICACNLFCYTPEERKDAQASEATKRGSLLQHAISTIKNVFPDLLVMADIALDPHIDHGHDGMAGPIPRGARYGRGVERAEQKRKGGGATGARTAGH